MLKGQPCFYSKVVIYWWLSNMGSCLHTCNIKITSLQYEK